MKPSKQRRLEARKNARESVELLVVLRSLGGFTRITESGELTVAVSGTVPSTSAPEGQRFEVILISEGLGNRRNLNYYGREAIESAAAIFEGKPCFLNHPALDDERNLPERRVQDKCGYFKNCRVVTVEGGKLALKGELHFDLSEAGVQAAQKSRTSIHYRKEFPDSIEEYVGLSVNADGTTEERELFIEGEKMKVNYVTAFIQAASCDLVTTPARGGRILALVESIYGTDRTNELNVVLRALQQNFRAA